MAIRFSSTAMIMPPSTSMFAGAGGEAVFVVDPKVELRESVGFNVRELSRAEDLIDDHLELIKQKWAEHLG
jgi:hypothetical protein